MMFRFTNLKIGIKMGFGYGAVIILMLVAIVVSYLGLSNSLQNSTELMRMTRNMAAVNEVGNQAIAIRLNARAYLVHQEEMYLEHFRQSQAAFDKALERARSAVKNPKRQALLGELAQKARNFEEGFSKILELIGQQAEAYGKRGLPNGSVMNETLGQLLEIAHQEKNPDVMWLAMQARNQMMLTRLFLQKYLTTENSTDFEKGQIEWKKISGLVEDLKGQLKDEKQRELLNRFGQAAQQYDAAIQDIHQAISQRLDLVHNNLDLNGPAMDKLVGEVIDSQKEAQLSIGDQTVVENQFDMTMALWLSLGTGVAGCLLAWLLARSITRPLRNAVTIAERVADGDLTVRIAANSRDEVGQLLQTMQVMAEQLKTMVTQVTQATGQVNSAAAEIAQGSADLSQRTEEQASALEQTASSMEELTATVKQSAEHAGQANQLASAARHQAEQGG
ncbi:MAG TPA: HAMP domain-containing protein, partial [Xanthomonadaceae bacterium]|nr:HAMP domain-containing protein [Xanthomonadaceae bacterium]